MNSKTLFGRFSLAALFLFAVCISVGPQVHASSLGEGIIVQVFGSSVDENGLPIEQGFTFASTQEELESNAIEGNDDGTVSGAVVDGLAVGDGGVFSAEGLTAGSENSPVWQLTNLDVSGITDPIANLAFSILNTSGAPTNISTTVLVPLGSFSAPATIISGSVGGSVVDSVPGTGGVSVSTTSPLPIYEAFIDGGSALTLITDPFSDDDPLDLSNVDIPTTSAGPLPFGAATTSIAIEINATIGAFDTLTITSTFEVIGVPEPTGMLLLSLAAPLALRRRR